MSTLLAGGTIFLSAFLLFQMQPMIAKAILPWFGGSAAVWSTCLTFFQSVLFLGYLYAHWLTRTVPVRRQFWVHGTLLVLSLAALPVLPTDAWKPSGDGNPALQILLLLAVTAGLPYFLLSSTSPLIQAWYARSRGALPYRYFALSNAASLVALLGYPVLVEPNVTLRDQNWLWSLGYAGCVAACGTVAWLASRSAAPAPAVEAMAVSPRAVSRDMPDAAPSLKDRLLWMLLAGFASILSLAVTNHISQNVAPIPMMWVLPLAVYLITFIVCFESDRWYSHIGGRILHGAALAGMGYLLVIQTPETNVRLTVPALLAGLFACCLFCHGELARRRPGAAYLTQFYLMIALGGAVGALLVGLVAPTLLVGPYDLAFAVAACGLFTLFLEYRKWWATDIVWTALAVGLFVAAGVQVRSYQAPAREAMRSFYGSLRVVEESGKRSMVHGVISHGMQYLDAQRRRTATMYYALGTGVERAIEATHPVGGGQRVGVIGLGAGTLAVYGHPGDAYRFYEINPQVVDLARHEFTYLQDSPAQVSVVTGDGRLALERESPQNFDLLVVDAFSGDSVPVHLLSREAMQLYFSHVRPGGLVAFHVSNSALMLAAVVRRLADDQRYASLRVCTLEDKAIGRSESDWVLVARHPEDLDREALDGQSSPFRLVAGLRPWTDDYSTLFPILK